MTNMDSITRIAHVIGCIAKGGVESVVFNYYKFIDKSKYQFDFIIHDDSPYEIPKEISDLGCNIYKVPPYKRLFSYIKALIKIFKENKYKIIHSHMSTISVFTLFAAKKANIPFRITHCHVTAGNGKGEFLRNIFKYFLRLFSKLYPTHLMSCSENSGIWMYGKKAFLHGKINVLNNAIDHKIFIYNENAREKTRNDLRISDKFAVGNVGRFMPQKNHDFLIDIFNELIKLDNNCVLLLAGDGKLRKKIEDKVNRYNLQNSVLFLGCRDDICNLYHAMDVFVLPSLYEGLPVVLVETQMAGLPSVISEKITKETKFTELIEFISLKKNAHEWAKIILEKRNTKKYDITTDSKYKRYSIENEVKRLEKIYEQIIS